jgi:predicted Fe-Mo cluster-binding NifX family protein
MKIAVTYEDGQIFQHFGHTQRFKVYEMEAGKVKTAAILDAAGSGHGALAGFLKNAQVDTLICGGIGGGAKQALAQVGIRLYGGVTGGADKAVEDFLADRLLFNPGVECAHHGQGHHHHGGTHSCGEHSCT